MYYIHFPPLQSPPRFVCPGLDSNQHDVNRHYPLKVACLPISPPGQFGPDRVSITTFPPYGRTNIENNFLIIIIFSVFFFNFAVLKQSKRKKIK